MQNKQPSNHCLNCGYHFDEHLYDYCPSCGQKRIEKLTMKTIFENLFSSYFSLDARILNTIGPFLFQPGRVARDYIDGRRKDHLSPSQLYFFFSFIVLLFISSLLVNRWENSLEKLFTTEFQQQTQPKDSLASSQVEQAVKTEIEEVKKELKEEDVFFELTPMGLETNVSEVEDDDIEQLVQYAREGKSNEEIYELVVDEGNRNKVTQMGIYFASNLFRNNGKGFASSILSQVTIATITGILLISLLLKVLYIRRKYSYAEHFVHIVYLISFYLVLTLTVLVANTIYPLHFWWVYAVLLSLVYLFQSMREVYQQSIGKTLLKTLLLIMGINNFIFPILIAIIFGLSFIQYSQ